METLEFVQVILGTYFLTSVLHRTDGPKGLLYKLRKNESLPFYCFACLVIYISIISVLFLFYFGPGLLVIAAAGGALFLNDVIERLL